MIGSICEVPEVLKVMRIVNTVISIIRIAVPIILIVSVMIDLAHAVSNAETNKITKKMVNKVIAAVLVFLIPVFVRVVADISSNNREYEKCLEKISLEDIEHAYSTKMEELVASAEESQDINDYNSAVIYLNNIKDSTLKSEYKKRLDEVKKEIDKKNEQNNGGYPTNDSGTLKIYYLGLGRYDGHLIIGNNTVMFIDSGYESQASKAIAFIKSLGITKIDALVGSHMHNNHIKGHIQFIKDMQVDHVYYGEDPGTCISRRTCVKSSSDPTQLMNLVRQNNIPMTILGRGLDQKIGGLTFDIVAPDGLVTGGRYPENNNSLNMILKFGNHKFYFSGDHVRSSEILKNYSASTLDVDIFKWPHHGQESVSTKFLDALSPSYIIVPNSTHQGSSSSGISYSKAKGFATGTDGYVLAESDGTTLTVTQSRTR